MYLGVHRHLGRIRALINEYILHVLDHNFLRRIGMVGEVGYRIKAGHTSMRMQAHAVILLADITLPTLS